MPPPPLIPFSDADAGAKNDEGQTAGDLAEEQGNDELADMLRQRSVLKHLQTFKSSSRGRHGGGAGGEPDGEPGQGGSSSAVRFVRWG